MLSYIFSTSSHEDLNFDQMVDHTIKAKTWYQEQFFKSEIEVLNKEPEK